MADKPILFSAPMVRALLDGRKSQTRRTLKPQVVCHSGRVPTFSWGKFSGLYPDDWFGYGNEIDGALPFAVGDRLWVREAWRTELRNDSIKPSNLREGIPVYYEAGGGGEEAIPECAGRLRASMHMPRWASRLTLTVTDVRVQRLQEISEADAAAEGVEPVDTERDEHDWSICSLCGGTGLHGALGTNLGVMEVDCTDCDTHKKRFQHLWNSLNASRGFGWEANPWVCALTFTVAHHNIDQEQDQP